MRVSAVKLDDDWEINLRWDGRDADLNAWVVDRLVEVARELATKQGGGWITFEQPASHPHRALIQVAGRMAGNNQDAQQEMLPLLEEMLGPGFPVRSTGTPHPS